MEKGTSESINQIYFIKVWKRKLKYCNQRRKRQ